MKKKSGFWNGIIGTIIIFLILFYGGSLILSVPMLLMDQSSMSPGWYSLLFNYLPVAILGVIFVLFMMWKDRDSLAAMLPKYGSNRPGKALFGLLAGFLCNAGLIMIACAAGNIRLSFRGMNIGFAVCAFIIVSLQCIGEEIMDRVFLYQRFKSARGHIPALVISAVLFSAAHISNMITVHADAATAVLGLLNIVLIGIYFAETVYYGNGVWFAFAFHSAWNFSQNFVFGLPNSGTAATESIFGIASESGGLVYNTIFGVEAAVTTTALIVILIAVTCIRGRMKQKEKI